MAFFTLFKLLTFSRDLRLKWTLRRESEPRKVQISTEQQRGCIVSSLLQVDTDKLDNVDKCHYTVNRTDNPQVLIPNALQRFPAEGPPLPFGCPMV
jgi:hypothetical protein